MSYPGAGPGHRPGGLTALAVLNFIFGGLGLLSILGWVLMLGLFGEVAKKAMEQIPEAGIIYLMILLSLVETGLLLASGAGYLGQKKFLGKILGSVYGIVGLVEVGLRIALAKDFGFMAIFGLIYPVLTLVLLNTVFKDDFPNP